MANRLVSGALVVPVKSGRDAILAASGNDHAPDHLTVRPQDGVAGVTVRL